MNLKELMYTGLHPRLAVETVLRQHYYLTLDDALRETPFPEAMRLVHQQLQHERAVRTRLRLETSMSDKTTRIR